MRPSSKKYELDRSRLLYEKAFFKQVPNLFKHRLEPLVLREFIPAHVCKNIIAENEGNKRIGAVSFKGNKSSLVVDNETKVALQVLNPKYPEELFWYLRPEALAPAINAHWNLNLSFKLIKDFPTPLYTVYEPGGFCRDHADVIMGKEGLLRPDRLLTILVYLNHWTYDPKDKDGFMGGEIMFSSITNENGPFTIHPRVGDVVIYPGNPYYRHLVPEVTAGLRHNLVSGLGEA